MSAETGQGGASRKILVVCLGNPDRGDDGIGAAVARALAGRLPDEAGLIVRSGDMLALIDDWTGCQAVVCVDAATTIGAPGGIHRIDLARDGLPPGGSATSSHAFGLADAVRLGGALGNAPATVVVYAVESACFDSGAPMTAEVAAAANEVARRVIDEVRRLAHGATAMRAPA